MFASRRHRTHSRFSRPGSRSRSLAAAAVVVLVGLAGCASPEEEFVGRVVSPPEPAPALTGVNYDGEPFALGELEGKVVVLFFGYTYCPDVCPFTLAKMQQVLNRLGADAGEVEVVFVSVDPHRDTLAKLADYVPAFDERFYGLHLTFDELEFLKDTFDLQVQYGQPKEGPGTDSFYYVDHTGTYYLIDREGRLRVTHPPNATADAVLADVETLIEE